MRPGSPEVKRMNLIQVLTTFSSPPLDIFTPCSSTFSQPSLERSHQMFGSILPDFPPEHFVEFLQTILQPPGLYEQKREEHKRTNSFAQSLRKLEIYIWQMRPGSPEVKRVNLVQVLTTFSSPPLETFTTCSSTFSQPSLERNEVPKYSQAFCRTPSLKTIKFLATILQPPDSMNRNARNINEQITLYNPCKNLKSTSGK